MNKVIFIFSFVCIFYSAQSQTSGDFILSNEVVYGNVLKIYQLTAEIPPGTSLEDPQNVRLAVGKIIDFNSHGQNVTVREMIPDGYEIKKTEYSYNSQNKPISGKVSTAQKRVAINLSFSYNGKGNLSEIRTIDTKDSVLLQEQRYNYSKRYLEIIQKNYGQLPAHYRHRVENGRLVESTLLDSSGQIIETTVRQYNSKGILEQTIKKDVAGQEINRVAFTYEFDEKGNWTKELSHDQQTDRYKLRTQSIVYRDEKLRIPSEEELQKAKEQLRDIPRFLPFFVIIVVPAPGVTEGYALLAITLERWLGQRISLLPSQLRKVFQKNAENTPPAT